MAECWRCPHTEKVQRKFGITTHCSLKPTYMDVSYFCHEKYKNEENSLCPFVCKETRFSGVDYRKYETEFLEVKG